MSVSDPLLKELKGYATKFLTECRKPITDEDPVVEQFCDCFERILLKGLLPQKTVISVILIPDCWLWLKKIGEFKRGIKFSYFTSLEFVENDQRVNSNPGKVRLLIRTCLVKRCLYVPIQYLVDEDKCRLLYRSSGVLGDPILTSILTSLLQCLATLTFDLNLSNAGFLETSWQLPVIKSLTFVPARVLGLSIMFVEGKGVIVDIVENSVAAESGIIETGDLLDSIDGVVINRNTQGSLSKIIKKAAHRPISLSIIKGVKDGKPFPGVLRYWQQAGVDPTIVQAKYTDVVNREENEGEEGSKLRLVGKVNTGCDGDVKQISLAINKLSECSHPIPVSIDCHPLGIRIISRETREVLKEHTYMEISACGSSVSPPSYFGFIAGDKNYTECKDFVCYIFHCTDKQIIESLVKTIGQGFKRTLFTV